MARLSVEKDSESCWRIADSAGECRGWWHVVGDDLPTNYSELGTEKPQKGIF